MKKTIQNAHEMNGQACFEQGIIPFADEANTHPAERTPGAVDAHDLGETADDEFGAIERAASIVDRDLGLDELCAPMGVPQAGRSVRYACPCCGQGAIRVMRVRVASQPSWVALCAVCAASMLVRYPGTIVGGMVRPTRRRRTNRTRIERKYARGLRAGAQQEALRRAS